MTIARTDLHQHLWTEPLLAALAARDRPPFARPANGRFVIYVANEAPVTIEGGERALERRLEQLHDDEIGQAVGSFSSPTGVESLPRAEAGPILAAYERGIGELPRSFRAWGALALDELDPTEVERVLDAGFVGLSLPAGALATPRAVAAFAPVLDRLERRNAPLFIHPGPGMGGVAERHDPGSPCWWPALTRYVFDMQSAWLAFLIEGRRSHPRLRVVFAMLAGCAPLHRERLAGRGGPASLTADPLTFYDCSSYGTQAVDAMVRCIGVEQIVFGSDRPVVEPPSFHLGPSARHAIEVTNPARALQGEGVAA